MEYSYICRTICSWLNIRYIFGRDSRYICCWKEKIKKTASFSFRFKKFGKKPPNIFFWLPPCMNNMTKHYSTYVLFPPWPFKKCWFIVCAICYVSLLVASVCEATSSNIYFFMVLCLRCCICHHITSWRRKCLMFSWKVLSWYFFQIITYSQKLY